MTDAGKPASKTVRKPAEKDQRLQAIKSELETLMALARDYKVPKTSNAPLDVEQFNDDERRILVFLDWYSRERRRKEKRTKVGAAPKSPSATGARPTQPHDISASRSGSHKRHSRNNEAETGSSLASQHGDQPDGSGGAEAKQEQSIGPISKSEGAGPMSDDASGGGNVASPMTQSTPASAGMEPRKDPGQRNGADGAFVSERGSQSEPEPDLSATATAARDGLGSNAMPREPEPDLPTTEVAASSEPVSEARPREAEPDVSTTGTAAKDASSLDALAWGSELNAQSPHATGPEIQCTETLLWASEPDVQTTDTAEGDENGSVSRQSAPKSGDTAVEANSSLEQDNPREMSLQRPKVAPPGGVPKVSGLGQTSRPTMRLRIPNGRVRQPYVASAERRVLLIVDDGGSGITLDQEGRLTGTPETAGDFVLKLQVADSSGRRHLAETHLTIVANPRDLWTSKPSDCSDTFWKPDQEAIVKRGEAVLLAGSRRGRSHAREGGFREDHCALDARPDGWHLMAVADGAGSARLSREGSRIACATVMEHLAEQVGPALHRDLEESLANWGAEPGAREADPLVRKILYPVLAGAAHQALKAIMESAKNNNLELRDYYTTLHCAIARKVSQGWFMANFSVGDGGAVVYDEPGSRVHVLCKPDGGEFAGQTVFLAPSVFDDGRSVMDRIHFTVQPTFTALALMTDGITDPFFPTDAVLADPAAWNAFWNKELMANVPLGEGDSELKQKMIEWLSFWSTGNHDDRTIALLLPEIAE